MTAVRSSRRRRTARLVAVAVGVALAAFVALLATRAPVGERVAASPLVGRPAPAVVGEGLDGRTVRLSSLRGRFVVVNFFATWCVPCQREHPELIRFRARHAGDGDAEVLAVVFDDDMGAVRRFFADRGGDWPVVADPRGRVALEFGVRGPPESFLVDPDGIVVTRIVGEVTDAGLEALLDRAQQVRSAREAGR